MIYEYFKREFEDFKVMIQLNPLNYEILELTIDKAQGISQRKLKADADIYQDLVEDDFKSSSPLEFNLLLKGIK
ncbi:MAG: hypothetical protein AAF843_02440 [Bacteroidota bacterium]